MVALSEPVWPALIQFEGDPELVFVRDRVGLQNESASLAGNFGARDRLIDSTGQLFRLRVGTTGEVELQALGEAVSLEAVLGLVKAHAAQEDSCCVAKLWAPTISEAFQIVESFND